MPSARLASGLLVSVRSPEEAEAAIAGGADIIDIKEPMNGSLGRATDETILAVLERVAGRHPVSAALGELIDDLPVFHDPRLAFVKWGLAGCGTSFLRSPFSVLGSSFVYGSNDEPRTENWRTKLEVALARPGNPRTVLVAYADWQCAQAPPLEDVVTRACQEPGNVLLIDTHCKGPGKQRKNRPTLLDWLPLDEIRSVCRRCRAGGVRVALAGSLDFATIMRLRPVDPDWFAVRGAVCADGNRQGTIDAGTVRRLACCLGHGD
jgi:uncharacterized protein (UPF0264 family)